MSYGNQLNIFREQSVRYGPNWRGIICCADRDELHVAADDAQTLLGGDYSKSAQTLSLRNGAKLLFRVVTNVIEAERAFIGREFTQIAWVHRPTGDTGEKIIGMARARLRSKAVPAADWRYEYCMMR